MPNGGPDCCGNCAHNEAVQKIAHPQPWADLHAFSQMSLCTLRSLEIRDPFWTYCDNFEYGKNPELRVKFTQPTGPVTSSGLYEGYVRVPWLGKSAPIILDSPSDSSRRLSCHVCGFRSCGGIRLQVESRVLEFCTNRHYIEWWNSQNSEPYADNQFLSELDQPEDRYEPDGSRKQAPPEEIRKLEKQLKRRAVGKVFSIGIFLALCGAVGAYVGLLVSRLLG